MSVIQLYCVYKIGADGNKSEPWLVEAMSRQDAREHYAKKLNLPLSQISAMTARAYDRWQEREQERYYNYAKFR